MHASRLLSQVLRFGVVGGIAFVIDYGTMMFFRNVIGVSTVVGAAIGFVVSVLFNWWASMRYVFVGRDDMSRSHQLFVFVVLSCIGLLINELVMVTIIWLLGDTVAVATASKVVATSIVMVWNFLSRKRWLEGGA